MAHHPHAALAPALALAAVAALGCGEPLPTIMMEPPPADAGQAPRPGDAGAAWLDDASEPDEGRGDAGGPTPDGGVASEDAGGASEDAGGARPPEPPSGTRDPWLRPFASTSIWNTPIGSAAVYVDAEWPSYSRNGTSDIWLQRTTARDPRRQFHRPYSWRDRCHPEAQAYDAHTHVPDGFVLADARQNANGSWSTPNNQVVFLQPDGRTVLEAGTVCRDMAGGQLVGHLMATYDLYGDGRAGGHGGSALSAFGGMLREGELTGDEPIRHALDLVLYTMQAATVDGRCHRWPATRCDGYAAPDHPSNRGRYQGDVPELQMGALLALPPDLRPADLGIETRVGRKLFRVMQDFGGYWTDDAAWESNRVAIDGDAEDDIRAFRQDAVRAEFGRIMTAVHVIANNGPESIGGGGTPRVAPHGELRP